MYLSELFIMVWSYNGRQPIRESISSPHQYGKFQSMLNEKRICSMFSFVFLKGWV